MMCCCSVPPSKFSRVILRVLVFVGVVAVRLFSKGPACAEEKQSISGEWKIVSDSAFAANVKGIVQGNRTNWLSIRTWQATGIVALSDIVSAPFADTVDLQRTRRKVDARFEFTWDADKRSLLSRWNPTLITYTRITDGTAQKLHPDEGARWTVITPEHSLTFFPGQLPGRRPRDPVAPNWDAHYSRVAKKQSSQAATAYSYDGDVIDPRVLFWDSLSPEYEKWQWLLDEIDRDGLMAIQSEIRNSGGRGILLEQQDTTHGRRYRLTSEVSAGRFVTIIDTSVGANIIDHRYGPLNVDKWEKEVNVAYQEVDGTFVPKSHEVTRRDLTTDEITLHKIITFESHALNGDIGAGAFTHTAFAMKIGDRLCDELQDEMYLVADGDRLVRPEEFEHLYSQGVPGYSERKKRATGREHSHVEGGRAVGWLLVVGNVAACGAIVFYLSIRRSYQRSKSRGGHN